MRLNVGRLKINKKHKLNVAKMGILCWVSGHVRQDKIKNECIREKVGIAHIVQKKIESCFKWFGHVRRKLVKAPVRRGDQMEGT